MAVRFGGELKLLVEVEDIRMIWLVNYTASNGKPMGISRLAIVHVNEAFSPISPLRADTRAKAYHFITHTKCNTRYISRVSQAVELLRLLPPLLLPYLTHNLRVIQLLQHHVGFVDQLLPPPFQLTMIPNQAIKTITNERNRLLADTIEADQYQKWWLIKGLL